MIKFFRRIRQNLLSEGKTGKYLKYAIGEIVLVVIGILLALQINNWNEERKEFVRSKNYLSEIVKDLRSDTLIFQRYIKRLTEDIKEEEWLLMQSDYVPEQIERIWHGFGGFYNDITINDRTFQKIQNAGSTTLFGFEALSDEITYYYVEMQKKLNSFTAWDKREVSERQEYMRDLEDHIEISNAQLQINSRGLVENDFPYRQDPQEIVRRAIAFANSTKGRNHFKNNYARHLRVRENFEQIHTKASELILKLEQELSALEK